LDAFPSEDGGRRKEVDTAKLKVHSNVFLERDKNGRGRKYFIRVG